MVLWLGFSGDGSLENEAFTRIGLRNRLGEHEAGDIS